MGKCYGNVLVLFFLPNLKKQSSYKYGFLRSLLENLYSVDGDLRLTYDQIFETFTRVYWVLVIKHQLSQTDSSHKFSAVERIMYEAQKKHSIPNGLDFDKLTPTIQLELFKAVKRQAKRNVIGALWKDSDGILYSFSHSEETVIINRDSYVFMQRY